MKNVVNDYWKYRKNFKYYETVEKMVKDIGANAKSLIDVGSNDTEYIARFDWIQDRVQLDIEDNFKSIAGIRTIREDFLVWEKDKHYDIAICLQVLEHVEQVEAFALKLRTIADKLIVSVPYNWHKNFCKEHLHDPINEEKLYSWIKINPTTSIIVKENSARLIAYYHLA